MLTNLKRFFIGRPLKSTELGAQKLNKKKALAVLSSDSLSSVAYGPEQILIVLIALGSAALWYSLPIALAVLVLLITLILSYRQIVFAYPNGGGAYMVAKENLGVYPGLLAGGSLLVDYILTVAVSVSAGTDALTSAFPNLYQHHVLIAILFVFVITLINLRGIRESATILAFPVYLFIGSLLVLIVTGLYQVLTGQISPNLHPTIGMPVMGLTTFIILRAFASGCSALTGIEAISNSIPNFKDPAPKNAANTLAAMGTLLAIMLAGIVFLAFYLGVTPNQAETVVSQMAANIFGRSWFYYLIQGTTTIILILAANTGYSAFPMLSFNLAKDKFVPRMFTIRGDRLGYSNGILILGLFSIILILAFKGETSRLIPLYAIGVFIPFSLSQAGMTVKWFRERPQGWGKKLAVNLLGTIITSTVVVIFLLTKFTQIWPILIFIPVIMIMFARIHKHYMNIADQLRVDATDPPLPHEGNIIIIPVSGITRVVENALNYARSLTDAHVIAVTVAFDKEDEKKFEEKWKAWQPDIRLVSLLSLHRSIILPLTKFVDTIEHRAAESNHQVTVIIPEFITKKRWHNILHNQSALLIRSFLLHRRNVVITTVPYHLKK